MRRAAWPVLAALVLAAGCSGDGGSIQEAGNTTTTAAVPDTSAPDDTGDPGATDAPDTTVAPATTTTTPLADLPECPVGALESVTAPVEITFWHGMTSNLEQALTALTDEYNASQDKVRVTLQNQGSYEANLDKYLQSGQGSRPEMIQAPEYSLKVLRDTESFIPVQACMEAEGFDTSVMLPTALRAYSTEGVQWSMPFNVSNPVLYYNRAAFAAAGLDPDSPPRSLEELRSASQALVDSGAVTYGLAVDTNFDSGGGWFIEQWFAKAGEFYADNENGRAAPATKVLFDNPTGVELYTFVQELVQDGLAYNVGENASGQDAFLKIADEAEPAGMTIGTSAALGTVLAAVEGGLAPGIGVEDIGIGQMPGPGGSPAVLVGGASLWIVADKGDAQAAAVWDFVKFLVQAESQSQWAADTGYVPVNSDASEVEPLATTYADDPRFRVAYDSLVNTPDEPTSVGPLLGPQREIRVLTSNALAAVLQGADVAAELTNAAAQANSLIAQYAARG